LLVFIDDATGQLVGMHFCHAESTFEYMNVTRRYLLEYGKPVAFYSDKHAVFRVNMAGGTRGEGITQFGRAPASDHDAHRKLIKAERVRIDDIFSWQESRAVTRSLTLQYDKVVYLIKPGPENHKIEGQRVIVFDYPDGRFKFRYEGRELPCSVFDRLSQIRHADIVNNKRLGATLAMALESQLETNERRSKSCPSRPFPSASSMQ